MAGRGGGGGGWWPWRRRWRWRPRRWRWRRCWWRGRWRIPRAVFQQPASEFLARRGRVSAPRSRPPKRQRLDRRCRRMAGPTAGFFGGNRPGVGERPGVANTPSWDNRLNAGNRADLAEPDVRREPADHWQQLDQSTTGRAISPPNAWQLERRQLVPRQLERQLEQRLEQLSAAGLGGGRVLGRRRPFRDSLVLGILSVLQPLLRRILSSMAVPLQLLAADRGGPAARRAGRRPAGPTAEQQATPLFDAARTAFMQGNYRPHWPR